MRLPVLLQASIALLLVGCGGGSPPKATDAPGDTPAADGTSKAAADDSTQDVGEISKPYVDCDVSDRLSCEMRAGCAWSDATSKCSAEGGK